MKIAELIQEDNGDPIKDIIAAIEKAMEPSGAVLADLMVEDDIVDFTVVYEFPEHKVPVGDVSAALNRKGRVRMDDDLDSNDDDGQTPINYTFKMSNEFDDYDAVEEAINKHFKDRMY